MAAPGTVAAFSMLIARTPFDWSELIMEKYPGSSEAGWNVHISFGSFFINSACNGEPEPTGC